MNSQLPTQNQEARIRVLLIAPYFDKNVAGESWCTYKWVEGICHRCDATVLTTHTPNWDPEKSPIEAKELVNWTHTKFKGKLARFDNELKPHYISFYRKARKWIKARLATGERFDIVHQINPVALRYPSPACGLGIPYILGPQAGSLPTPDGFREECKDNQWYRKMRNLDALRIKYDPWLRRSFGNAAVIMGVAPYVQSFLAAAKPKQFTIMAETGPDTIIETPKDSPAAEEPLKLLFVGRIIRTKGVIDAVRAVAKARGRSNITLDVIGVGDSLEQCQSESEKLGVSDIVTFHGRIPRSEVFDWYRKSHIFLFPSFREPSGTVVFEALGFGLPLITANFGGPGYVVTKECGYLVDPNSPEQYSDDLASAIIEADKRRDELPKYSAAAIARVREVADWDIRFNRVIEIYNSTLNRLRPNESTNDKQTKRNTR